MKVVAIIQARMSSSRLPGKVLLDLAGRPMLDRVVTRVRRAAKVDFVGVATSTDPSDDLVAEFCRRAGMPVHRGSLHDVLDRYHTAAAEWAADVVVRVTADCPLIDPWVVDEVVTTFRNRRPDVEYVSNVIPVRTYPHGLDVEAFSTAALDRAWREDSNQAWREHVTPYLYRRPDLFRSQCVTQPDDHSAVRWTVDTPADFDRVSRIYAYFGTDRFTWVEALVAEAAHPAWGRLNRDVAQRTVD